MSKLQQRRPADIRPGDRINHDGYDVQVTAVRQLKNGWWMVFYVEEATGSGWGYYGTSFRPTVSRYE